MAVFCPVHKQHPVSGTHRQTSKAPQVLIFVYGTFKDIALWHRSPVYISAVLEAKM